MLSRDQSRNWVTSWVSWVVRTRARVGHLLGGLGRHVSLAEQLEGGADHGQRGLHVVTDSGEQRAPDLTGRLVRAVLGELQAGAASREQLACRERLHHVVVCTGLDGACRRLGAGPRGEEHHRRGAEPGVGADLLQEPETVQVGHHHVGHHEVDAACSRRHVQRGEAVRCRRHASELGQDPGPGETLIAGVVLRDQDRGAVCELGAGTGGGRP